MAEQRPLAAPDPRWAETAQQITFATPYRSLWEPGARSGEFFVGGRLNLSVNCLDRHLAERGERVAVCWEGEPGDRRSLTYAALHEQVQALTRALRSLGVGPGDRVGVHLGWLPETVVVMLACTRIGAVHTLLPVPLPAEALADRLAGVGLKVLFTQDGAWRHGTVLPLKARADEALTAAESVEHTVVVRRTGMDVPWYEGDRWYHDLVAATRPGAVTAGDDEPEPLPSAHPVCTIPQANRGGQPVLVRHGTATMLAGAIAVHRQLSAGGVFWCAGDISWAVTQIHGVYGPLACGGTAVMYEGTLDVPTHERAWEIVRRYGVETLLTSPSVVRTVRGWARAMPEVSTLPALRRIVTAGEPIEEELREWLVDALGEGSLDVGDAWGQLELGGIVRVAGLPASPERVPLPDCGLDIVDDSGQPVPDGEPGEVVLRLAWAGTMVGVDGAAASVVDQHWTRYPGLYATGDLAARTPAGVAFLGRTDDVVSISGQLVSLREVREVLAEHPYVAAVDVAVRKDPTLGRSLVAAVALSRDVGRSLPTALGRPPGVAAAPGVGAWPGGAAWPDLDAVAVDLMDAVRQVMGGLARPRAVLFVDRFGDELSRVQRAEAFATLATVDRREPRVVTWEQVLAAAGHRR